MKNKWLLIVAVIQPMLWWTIDYIIANSLSIKETAGLDICCIISGIAIIVVCVIGFCVSNEIP